MPTLCSLRPQDSTRPEGLPRVGRQSKGAQSIHQPLGQPKQPTHISPVCQVEGLCPCQVTEGRDKVSKSGSKKGPMPHQLLCRLGPY